MVRIQSSPELAASATAPIGHYNHRNICSQGSKIVDDVDEIG